MLDTPSQVTIVLVTYNSKAVVGIALKSIPKGIPVIVVDNASSDGTPDYIYEHFPSVTIINNKKNIGFGPANNIALEQIETPFSLLMNPDACFIDPTTIDGLLDAAERYPEAAVLAPGIIDESGCIQTTLPAPLPYRREMNWKSNFLMMDVEGDSCAYSLSGALMLLNMKAFDDAPYIFDPNIFMYYEDDDICLSSRKRGYSCMIIPSIKVMHLEGQSSLPSTGVECIKTRHHAYSQLYIMGKHFPEINQNFKASKKLLMSLVRVVTAFLQFDFKKSSIAYSRVQGVAKYLFGI